MGALAAEDMSALEDAFSRLLRDASAEQDVRSAMETESGFDPEFWQQLTDMGITGLLVPEAHGGSGAGAVEIERLMEHAGAALLCGPLLASAVLSVQALVASGDGDACDRLLPGIADGSRIVTLAMTGTAGSWTADGVDVRGESAGGAWCLSGTADFVLHGRNATQLLVAAKTASGTSLFEVDADAEGLSLTQLPAFDHTLRIDRIEFNGVSGQLIGSEGKGWDAVSDALRLALVALAGEQAGGARKALEITVEYAKLRHQFGRAIGSFQAVKHMAADLVVESESALSAARKAAVSLAEDAEDADEWISLAAFACADAFTRVTKDAIQMHGGIAFTWEHPAHLYLRRARADEQLLGNSNYHREQYLRALEA